MSSEPVVSIVMTSFNRAHTLDRAINSVLFQTYRSLELILVDDGSTDDTTRVLTKYNDPRLRVLRHEHNRGPNAAKNTGIAAVSGDYYTIMDSDDELVPHALETMLMALDGSNRVVCPMWDVGARCIAASGRWVISRNPEAAIRLNENLRGFETVSWRFAEDEATASYVEEALYLYHTEGDDRLCKEGDPNYRHNFTVLLTEETAFLDRLAIADPAELNRWMLNAVVVLAKAGDAELAKRASARIDRSALTARVRLIVWLACALPAPAFKAFHSTYAAVAKTFRA